MERRAGDAYADLVIARAPALLRLAVMLTGRRDEAEDLLQEALMRAHRHGDRIVEMAAPAAYLRQVLLNEHLSARRRLRRRPAPQPLPAEPRLLVAPADPFAPVENHDQVWRWMAALPPRQRAVLVLRFYEDLDDPEIAAVLGCSPVTVRAHASKALATIRTHIHEQEERV